MKYLPLFLSACLLFASDALSSVPSTKQDPVTKKIEYVLEHASDTPDEKDPNGLPFYCLHPETDGRYSVTYCASRSKNPENGYLLTIIRAGPFDMPTKKPRPSAVNSSPIEMRLYKKPGKFGNDDLVRIFLNADTSYFASATHDLGVTKGDPFEAAKFFGCAGLPEIPIYSRTVILWPLDAIVNHFIDSKIINKLNASLGTDDPAAKENIFWEAEDAARGRIVDLARKQIEKTKEYKKWREIQRSRGKEYPDPLDFYVRACAGLY